MSEKGFTFYYERGNEVVFKDNGKRLSNKQLVDLLNNQQSPIQSLQREIEELGISIKLFEDDIATKDKKIDDQQSTIEQLERRTKFLEKLAEVQ